MQFICKVLDPASTGDKERLQLWVRDGWEMCGCYKPSIFSRKVVFYFKRQDQ